MLISLDFGPILGKIPQNVPTLTSHISETGKYFLIL